MVAQRHLWRHAMTDPLNSVLFEIEQFGTANDASTTERPRRMLNITRDTGEFLSVLVKATRAQRVLEIGTSNGYSTLWLASAARWIGGSVTTVDFAQYKIGLASANFARAGLASCISAVHDDAGRVLERSAEGAFVLSSLIPSVRSIQDGGRIQTRATAWRLARGRQRNISPRGDGAVCSVG